MVDVCVQLSELQVESVKVHKLSEEQQKLRSRLTEVEAARTQAQDQVCELDQDLRELRLHDRKGGMKKG